MPQNVLQKGLDRLSMSSPIIARLGHEIPKPRDWQAFQRCCQILFRAELNDPHAQEFGRNGQDQGGIDVLGRRSGSSEKVVGVQCRLISKPMNKIGILKECRKAIEFGLDLSELIFATTAPDDTQAALDAITVEKELRSEGIELRVVVYGWTQLQQLIALHDAAYAAFWPQGEVDDRPISLGQESSERIVELLAAALRREQRHASSVAIAPPPDIGHRGEDPALHARIDVLRDLKADGPLRVVEARLVKLLETEELDSKPWAKFRIITNLAGTLLAMGRNEEACARFRIAYELRSDDAIALSNLATAKLIEGDFEGAMASAQDALKVDPESPDAVSILLQAAARSDWKGDPLSLIPLGLVGTVAADVGLAEYLRRRAVPGWEARVRSIAASHKEDENLARASAIATLSLLVGSEGKIDARDVSSTQVRDAADTLRKVVLGFLECNYEDVHDFYAYAINASYLLRLSGRHSEVAELLTRVIDQIGPDNQAIRLLALSKLSMGKKDEAIDHLKLASDRESEIMRLDLIAADDPERALQLARSIREDSLSELERRSWLRLVAELALDQGEDEAFRSAVEALKSFDDFRLQANLLQIEFDAKSTLGIEEIRRRLSDLHAEASVSTSTPGRVLLAMELTRRDLPGLAVSLLREHVSISVDGPATRVYLRALAANRDDAEFYRMMDVVPDSVRSDPSILWLAASHAWNVGNLSTSLKFTSRLMEVRPRDGRAALLRIDILLRKNKVDEVAKSLALHVEDMDWSDVVSMVRIGRLLANFGYMKRATQFMYRLFLTNRNHPSVWMGISSLVFALEGGEEERAWVEGGSRVGSDSTVLLRFDDGSEQSLTIEPDKSLRELDSDSWEPEHRLAKAISGMVAGAEFGIEGRRGTVVSVKHKYIALFHFILENYEHRFPGENGFKKVSVALDQPGGLDEIVRVVKARSEHVERERQRYRKEGWPVALFAQRIGAGIVDVLEGLSTEGEGVRVSNGSDQERRDADLAISSRRSRGGVLDITAFWNAWRLGVMPTVKSVLGAIYLPRSVVDILLSRAENLKRSAKNGAKTMGYQNGRLVLDEAPESVVQKSLSEVVAAIDWVEEHATVVGSEVNERTPRDLVNLAHDGRTDMFDSMVIAGRYNALYLSDDYALRVLYTGWFGLSGAWLHRLLAVSRDSGLMTSSEYVTAVEKMILWGQSFISVGVNDILTSMELGCAMGPRGASGSPLLRALANASADFAGRVNIAVSVIDELWFGSRRKPYAGIATGKILENLLENEMARSREVLEFFRRRLSSNDATEYLKAWERGHFIQAGWKRPRV